MQNPTCPECDQLNDRWHDNYKWIGKYKANAGCFLELTCHKCKHVYVGWMGKLWWVAYPREEARDITA